MKKIEIKSIYGAVLFSWESENNTQRETILEAIKSSADLSSADLSSADLSYANLRSANLSSANLRSADLSFANLSSANLSSANLRYADLSYANLSYANLSSADLRSADLSFANLSSANLSSANLRSADLRFADLSSADLSSANLRFANLRSADLRFANLRSADLRFANLSSANLRSANLSEINHNEGTGFLLSQCPTEGTFIAWKKAGEYIVKLRVTENAKRSSATTLKCRCSEAEVLDIQDLEGNSVKIKEVKSNQDSSFVYRVGEIVKVDDFDENRFNECSKGIHFFIARESAVQYE